MLGRKVMSSATRPRPSVASENASRRSGNVSTLAKPRVSSDDPLRWNDSDQERSPAAQNITM